MKRILQSGFAFAALSLFIVGSFIRCGQKAVQVKDEEVTTDTASTEAKLKLDQIFVNIPSPMELTKELSKSGINYNKSLLNSASRAGSYSTNYKSAIALGSYGADVGYTISYAQTQDALGYMNAIRQLADKVGVGAAFDPAMMKRFEENAANHDTLESIIGASYEKASRNLRSNKRVSIAAIVAGGGWIEGLYLSTQALNGIKKDEKNNEAFQRVWNQLYAYKYVTELLNVYQKDADCAQMTKDISPIAEMADAYSKKTTVNAEDVKAISEKITAIRNGLLN